MGSHSVTCHPAEVTFPPLPQPKPLAGKCRRTDTVPLHRPYSGKRSKQFAYNTPHRYGNSHSAWSESRPKNVVFGIFDQKSRIAQHFQPSIYHNAAVRARIRQKERFGGSRAQTGSRNMAATRFSDSATPTCFKTKSRPKYTTTYGFADPLQV